MAQLKSHLLKALANRKKAVDKHREDTLRQAGLAATAADLAAGAAAAGKIPRASTPPQGTKGSAP